MRHGEIAFPLLALQELRPQPSTAGQGLSHLSCQLGRNDLDAHISSWADSTHDSMKDHSLSDDVPNTGWSRYVTIQRWTTCSVLEICKLDFIAWPCFVGMPSYLCRGVSICFNHLKYIHDDKSPINVHKSHTILGLPPWRLPSLAAYRSESESPRPTLWPWQIPRSYMNATMIHDGNWNITTIYWEPFSPLSMIITITCCHHLKYK